MLDKSRLKKVVCSFSPEWIFFSFSFEAWTWNIFTALLRPDSCVRAKKKRGGENISLPQTLSRTKVKENYRNFRLFRLTFIPSVVKSKVAETENISPPTLLADQNCNLEKILQLVDTSLSLK